MAKLFKYGLIAASGLIILVGSVVAYIVVTFNPNDYKSKIVEVVKEKKQRTLRLDGDIKLSFFPNLGADLGKLSLSEHKGAKEFAAMESARVSLKVMPLLSKQIVVDVIEIKGARASLVRHKDGTTNFDDLLEKDKDEKSALEFKFDIDHVLLQNATLGFVDERTGATYALSNVNLKTGRIADGTPVDVDLDLGLQSSRPSVNVKAKTKTRFTFDLSKKHYSLAGLDLDVRGDAVGFSGLALTAKGDVQARPDAAEFSVTKLAITIAGKHGSDIVDVKLNAPSLSVLADKVTGEQATLQAKILQPTGHVNATLGVAALAGTAKAFQSAGVTLDIDAKQGDSAIKGKLSSPLSGSIAAERYELTKLVASATVNNPKFPGGAASIAISGSALVDLAKQSFNLNVSTKFDESSINGRVGLTHFSPPAYSFDLNVDRLDVDRYLPPAKAEEKKPEAPLDLSVLKTLHANGSLKIGALKVSNIKAQNVRLDLKAANGRLDVSPLSASLYEGAMNGALVLSAAGPQITLKQTLNGVSVGPLLRDVAGKDLLEGKGSIGIDVSGQGATVTAIKRALNGTATLNLADGALKGINIAASIRNARAKLGAAKGEQTQAANASEKTDFSELKGSFAIRGGIAHNSDLSLKSPLLRLGGEGDINIGADSMDYLAKATLVASAAGQGGKEAMDLKGVTIPVRISGPFAQLSYKLDFNAMLTGAAQQKIEEKKEEIKAKVEEKVKDQLQDRIKGLFGR